MEDPNKLGSLDNWTEISRGYYRYVIASSVCYEIIVWYNADGDVLTSKASLYITGLWHTKESPRSIFERECLLSEQPVFECLKEAVQDDKLNNK